MVFGTNVILMLNLTKHSNCSLVVPSGESVGNK